MEVLCNLFVSEVVNKLLSIKINEEIFVIRVLEETFAEDFVFLDSDRRSCFSKESSLDESDFVEEALATFENVSETVFSSQFREDGKMKFFGS